MKPAVKIIICSLIIPVAAGFIGAYLFINYGQNWIRVTGINSGPGKDNLVTVLQDDKNKVLKVTEESSTIDIAQAVAPSVVSVTIKKDVSQQPVDPFFDFSPFDQFFGTPTPQPTPKSTTPNIQKVGGGSGFIITADGYILTNRHVISDTEAQYTVTLNDGKEYPAKVIGTDLFNDVGVLKIDAKNLPVLKLGNSDDLKVGQTVIAMGNALAEFPNSVTKGVISGMGRSVVAGGGGTSENLEDVIQTDAAINPGNSGGPLLNLAGEVVGVNTAVSNQGQLIGFAIPINSVKKIVQGIVTKGEIIRPYLGVRYVLITDALVQQNNLPLQQGALVTRGKNAADIAVIPGSPADKAGIVENDIIESVNGKVITEQDNLAKLISGYNPGDQIKLKVYSKGKEKEVTVTLEQYKPSN
ncbi:MAG: trypsin-like peptidase domain-containing protein [Candidatus Komeilibacteria bacterium]